ncbi:MAG TPA: Rieske 2Fe-2S domain-containing protein [Polyangiaceae bacterium]|nr:Rieske 2Fe-2S domain-containing protein [Polyangiaceae bacterium]
MAEPLLAEGELWIGEMRAVVHRGVPLLLVRHEHGVSAYRDRCPHQGYPLSQGELKDGVLTCGLHGHKFDAASGDGVNPRRPCLAGFSCWVEAGQIFVELPEQKRSLP